MKISKVQQTMECTARNNYVGYTPRQAIELTSHMVGYPSNSGTVPPVDCTCFKHTQH